MPMFSRRDVMSCLLGVLTSGLVGAGAGTGTAEAGGIAPIAPGGITLRQALEKGLKARRPSEFAFIARVVGKVDQGDLPQKMVERTFLWARNHHQPYPMPYFEKAMQIQAGKLNVDL